MYKIIGADQKEYGPVSAEQIKQWIAEGRVNGHTRVQLAGSTEWTTVGNLPEFASVLPAAPVVPPAPPLPSGGIALPARPPRTDAMAVWSLVTGILSMLCCGILVPLSLVSVILGIVSLSRLRQHPEETGSGMAITGIVLGALALLIAVSWMLFWAVNGQEVLKQIQSQMPQ